MHNHTLEMEAERMAFGVEVNVALGEAAAQEKWTFLMQVESSKKGDVGWFWCPVSYPTILTFFTDDRCILCRATEEQNHSRSWM